MLDELRGQWEKMVGEQTENLKELVNSSVNDALAKRKEQVKYKKELQSDGSGQGSSKNATNQVATAFYEKKIEDFENKFAEKEREKDELR